MLYGFMGLWSKMCDWMDGVEWMGDTPQTVMTTRAPAVLKTSFFSFSLSQDIPETKLKFWKKMKWKAFHFERYRELCE